MESRHIHNIIMTVIVAVMFWKFPSGWWLLVLALLWDSEKTEK
jgi:hypothetical protein